MLWNWVIDVHVGFLSKPWVEKGQTIWNLDWKYKVGRLSLVTVTFFPSKQTDTGWVDQLLHVIPHGKQSKARNHARSQLKRWVCYSISPDVVVCYYDCLSLFPSFIFHLPCGENQTNTKEMYGFVWRLLSNL